MSLGKEPISADHPAGSDVRYEPEFEELQAEIDKLSSPSSSGGIKWDKVGKLASEILSTKAKDLLVASYLAVAQVHNDKVEGFALGLRVYRDIVEQFWDSLFPAKKRMRGRVAAIEWWMEKTETASEGLKLESMPPERIEELREDLRKIDEILSENMSDAPLLRPIERFLDSIPVLAEEKPENEPAPSDEESTLEEKSPAEVLISNKKAATRPIKKTKQPTAAPAEAAEMASAADANKILRAALKSFRQVSEYLQKENFADPMTYRWRRVACWSSVESLPPDTDGKTIIPPPDSSIPGILIDLKEKENWQALAEAAESGISEFLFWLDLNRFVAEALTGLGGPYENAHEVVCQETTFFVHRLSGIENLSFADGTPFADPETKQWLRSISPGSGASMAGAVTAGGGDDGGHVAEAIQKAQDLAKKKKLAEAVSFLQERLRSSFSGKEQLLWRMGLSQILLSAKKPQLASPHLESILQDIDAFRLEEWEPDLALKGLKMSWLGLNALSNKESKAQAANVLNRIAKLDAAGALSLGK